eukprot:scaffold276344_cov18-Tisochrysis_lutea.AAC.1
MHHVFDTSWTGLMSQEKPSLTLSACLNDRDRVLCITLVLQIGMAWLQAPFLLQLSCRHWQVVGEMVVRDLCGSCSGSKLKQACALGTVLKSRGYYHIYTIHVDICCASKEPKIYAAPTSSLHHSVTPSSTVGTNIAFKKEQTGMSVLEYQEENDDQSEEALLHLSACNNLRAHRS